MAFTFDGPNKLIILSSGTTSISVRDMYSRWKDWVVAGTGAVYLDAFRVVGGDPTSGANAVSSYFFLLNGWRVRPDEADHQLVVEGSLIVDGGGIPYVPTVGSYNVQIIADVPVKAETVTINTGGGVGTPEEVADAVWDAVVGDHAAANTFGERLGSKVLTVAKFLGLK